MVLVCSCFRFVFMLFLDLFCFCVHINNSHKMEMSCSSFNCTARTAKESKISFHRDKDEKNLSDFEPINWDPMSGHLAHKDMKDPYPYIVRKSGIHYGITMVISDDAANNDIHCNNLLQGYAITLHFPSRMPSTKNDFFLLPANHYALIPLDSTKISTSETMSAYSVKDRDCYFRKEKKLQYFKEYTYKNCIMECVTNITLYQCGCVNFYMPRTADTKLCGPGKQTCAKSAQASLALHRTDRFKHHCGCLPSCIDISYTSKINAVRIHDEQIQSLKDSMKFNVSSQFSIMKLYFKGDRVHTTERHELYGPIDFISNFGGLLGLFTGFSALSLMEIVYFLTLRLVGNRKLFGHWEDPVTDQSFV